MKRIAFIAGVLFVGLGLSLWLLQSFEASWEPHLRSILETEASRRLHAPVHVDRIYLSFKNGVVLDHVTVLNPDDPLVPLFQASSISLGTNLLDLPRAFWRRTVSEAVGTISIQSPTVRLNPVFVEQFLSASPSHTVPLWLTLTWSDGTLYWTPTDPPLQPLSLTQSRGIFRIRGPKHELFVAGSTPISPHVRFHFSQFRQRWSTDAEVKEMDWKSARLLYSHVIGRDPLPETLDLEGKADIALKAQGAGPVRNSSLNNIQEARVTFLKTTLQFHPSGFQIEPAGSLVLRGSEMGLSELTLKAGELALACKGAVRGLPSTPELDLTLNNTQTSWPFQTVHVQARWLNNHWEFLQNRLSLAKGFIDMKGWASADQLDIQITGQDIDLSSLRHHTGKGNVRGKLQATLVLRGTPQDPQLTGTLWVESLVLGPSLPENVQGDVEWAEDRFHIKLNSPDSQFYVQADGSNEPDEISIEKAALRWRNGLVLMAEGSLGKASHLWDLSLHTEHLTSGSSQTEIPVQGRLRGPINDPILDLTLKSGGLSAKAHYHREESTGTFQWTHSGLRADGTWRANSIRADVWELHGETRFRSPDGKGWDLPIRLQGEADFTEGRKVSAELNAPEPRWQTQTFSPFQASLHWSENILQGQWQGLGCRGSIDARTSAIGITPLHVEGKVDQGGHFDFSGKVPFDFGTLDGQAHIQALNLKALGEALALPQPLEGLAQGTLTLQGSVGHWELTGQMEGGPISYGRPDRNPIQLQTYNVQFSLKPPEENRSETLLTFTQATAKTAEEEIRITPQSQIEFVSKKTGRFRLGTEIRNLHLGWLTLFGGLDMDGTWKVESAGFHLDGNAYTRSLYLNDYELEKGRVHLDYYDRILTFEPVQGNTSLVRGILNIQNLPQIVFKDFSVSGKEEQRLHISGDVGPKHWDFNLQGEQIDLHTLAGLAGFPYSLEGDADLTVRGTGSAAYPNLSGQARLKNGQILGLRYQTGYTDFLWQGQHMTLTQLTLSDPSRYTLMGTGVFPLTGHESNRVGDKAINFSVRLLNSNLGLLQSLYPEIKEARGNVQGLLHVTGTTDNPQFSGSLQVRYGDIVQAHYFRRLKDFYLTANFDDNVLRLREFRGRSGEGRFEGQGWISFAGFSPKAYDLTLRVPSEKGIQIQVPELAIPEGPFFNRLKFLTSNSQGEAKGYVEFKGPAETPTFSGTAEISNGHFTFPPSTKNPPPAGFTEFIRKILWDVQLKFVNGAWFENELLQANLLGGLQLKGPSDRLRVDGGMDIVSGSFSYLGIDFDIRQARFDMRSSAADPKIINTPYVRGTGEAHVQSVDPVSGGNIDDTITLLIDYAPLDEIKPRLVSNSNPTLPQEKVLARLTQMDVENLTPQERTYLYQQQVVRLLDTSLTTPLARNLLKRTGLVDEFRVSRVINPANAPAPSTVNDPNQQQNSAVNLFAGTKYTVAKNLSSRLSLGYGVRFEQITTQELQNKLDLRSDVELSYRMLSNVYLKGAFDLPSSTPGILPERRVTIEPRWRFGWWGHTNKDKEKKPAPNDQK